MFLDTIIGHSEVKKQVINSIKNDRFSHAHIICGEDGIGKGFIAKGIAIYLLGEEEDKQYADIIEFGIEKNKKTIGIDNVKSIIKEINIRPYEKDKKVIIIHNGESMTLEAQNAFLKTIEEPPKGVYILILCENVSKLLDTIRSRCEIYKLNHLKQDEMIEFLKEKYDNLQEDNIKTIIAFSDCIPGRAEKFLKDETFKDIRNLVINILKDVNHLDEDLLKFEDKLVKFKGMWQEVLTCFLSYIRDVFIYKETGRIQLLVNQDKIEDIKEISEIYSMTKLNNIVDIVKDTRVKLDRNVNAVLVFDSMLLRIQEV